jgi:hypothetical protein
MTGGFPLSQRHAEIAILRKAVGRLGTGDHLPGTVGTDEIECNFGLRNAGYGAKQHYKQKA